jgi:hypothetical protein
MLTKKSCRKTEIGKSLRKIVAENQAVKFLKFALNFKQKISINSKAESEVETGKCNWLRCVLKFMLAKMA